MAALRGRRAIAAYLGICEDLVSRWSRDRGLPLIRIGAYGSSSVITTTEAITQWLVAVNAAQWRLQRSRNDVHGDPDTKNVTKGNADHADPATKPTTNNDTNDQAASLASPAALPPLQWPERQLKYPKQHRRKPKLLKPTAAQPSSNPEPEQG